MQAIREKQTNSLRSLFEGFNSSGIKFREKVCEECGWSESTFYRKMREIQKIDSTTGKLTRIFSTAEMEKIKDLAWEVQAELKDLL